MSSRAWSRLALAAAVLGSFAVYILRLDTAAGLMVDDAWYIVLAKALAHGDGYALISSATSPILPAVPPGFPFLLSLVFRIASAFPENVVLLKAISIAAMAILAVVGYLQLTRHERIPPAAGVLIVIATLLTPALVFLATSTVMADVVFASAQMCAVFWIERLIRSDRDGPSSPVIAGAWSAAAMLTRSAGLAVIVAGVIGCCYARRWRQCALYATTVIACLAPWQWYAYQHAPTRDERVAHGGSIAYSYSELISMNRGGDLARGRATAQDWSKRVARNLQGVLRRDLGAVVVPSLYRGAAESGEEVVGVAAVPGIIPSMGAALGTQIVSGVLATIMLAGWWISAKERWSIAVVLAPVTLAMILLVPDQTFRYWLPFTLFLFFFLWRGLLGIGRALRAPIGQSLARVVLSALLGLNLLDHGQYILMKQGTAMPEWIADAREVDEVLTWMSAHLDGPGAVASTNPGLVYLRTGRRALATDNLPGNWAQWRTAGVKYVVALRSLELPPAKLAHRRLYQTGRSKLWVVELCSGAPSDNSC